MRLRLFMAMTVLALAAPGTSLGRAAPSSPHAPSPGAPSAQRSASSSGQTTLPSRLAELGRSYVSLSQADTARQGLLRRLDRYRQTIRDTQRQPAGPSRDFRLRRLLAESQALAKEISALDREIATLHTALNSTRRALATLLEGLRAEDRARVQTALEHTRQADPPQPRVLKVAKPRIDPLDGPREIEEKADALKDSEDKIRKQISELEGIISNLDRRRRLRAISSGVDRYTGVFNEDSSSRRVVRVRPTKSVTEGPISSAPPEGNRDGKDTHYDSFTGVGEDPQVGAGSRTISSGTYAVVLRELLTPQTLNALRQAGRSKDPEERRRALERARDELQRTATGLQRQSASFRERARQIRTQEQK